MKYNITYLQTVEKEFTVDVNDELIRTEYCGTSGKDGEMCPEVDSSDLNAAYRESHLDPQKLLVEFKGLCRRLLASEDYRENPMLLRKWADDADGWTDTDNQIFTN